MKWILVVGALAAGPLATAGAEVQAQVGEKPPPPKGAAAANDARAEEEARRKLEEAIARDLGAAPDGKAKGTAPAAAATATGTAGATGGNPLARLLLLPDISVIGRGALVWNQLDTALESPRGDLVAPPRKLDPVFQELELALQAVVDPYVRGDVFLTFGPEGAAVEEAFVTTLGLPASLQVRAGIFHAPFGRLNQQHPHVWDFVDGPLAQARLVAGDSLAGPGLDVAWLAPLPWFAELHLAYQKTTPASEADGRRSGLARLVQFVDLAEGMTLGLGLSAARLDEPAGAWRDLYGGDLFLKVRPVASRSYLTLQAELFGQRLSGTGDPAKDGTRRGGYLQGLWRIDPFWAVGARWEAAPAQGPGPGGVGTVWSGGSERRLTGLASWYLTEFQRLRLQVSRDALPGGRSGLEALLAIDFAMGVHGAHPF